MAARAQVQRACFASISTHTACVLAGCLPAGRVAWWCGVCLGVHRGKGGKRQGARKCVHALQRARLQAPPAKAGVGCTVPASPSDSLPPSPAPPHTNKNHLPAPSPPFPFSPTHQQVDDVAEENDRLRAELARAVEARDLAVAGVMAGAGVGAAAGGAAAAEELELLRQENDLMVAQQVGVGGGEEVAGLRGVVGFKGGWGLWCGSRGPHGRAAGGGQRFKGLGGVGGGSEEVGCDVGGLGAARLCLI